MTGPGPKQEGAALEELRKAQPSPLIDPIAYCILMNDKPGALFPGAERSKKMSFDDFVKFCIENGYSFRLTRYITLGDWSVEAGKEELHRFSGKFLETVLLDCKAGLLEAS